MCHSSASRNPAGVIPAQAGIQQVSFLRKQESRKKQLDSHFRGNDTQGRESPAEPRPLGSGLLAG